MREFERRTGCKESATPCWGESGSKQPPVIQKTAENYFHVRRPPSKQLVKIWMKLTYNCSSPADWLRLAHIHHTWHAHVHTRVFAASRTHTLTHTRKQRKQECVQAGMSKFFLMSNRSDLLFVRVRVCVFTSEWRDHVRVYRGNVLAVDADAPTLGVVEPKQEPQDGALTWARRPHLARDTHDTHTVTFLRVQVLAGVISCHQRTRATVFPASTVKVTSLRTSMLPRTHNAHNLVLYSHN